MIRFLLLVLLSTLLVFPTVTNSQTTDEEAYIVGYAIRGEIPYSFTTYNINPAGYAPFPIMDIAIATDMPQWSPDNTQVALVHRPLAFYSPSGYYPQVISIINAQGIYQDTILQPQTYVRDVRWSPDGKQLVFLSGGVTDAVFEELEIVNADGSDRHKLLPDDISDPQNIFAIEWSPDGSQIAFLGGEVNGSKIHLVNSDGSNYRVIGKGFKAEFATNALYWTSDQQNIILLGYLSDSNQSTLLQIDISTGEVLSILNDDSEVAGFDISADEQHAVLLTWHNQLKIYNLTTDEVECSIEIGDYLPDYGMPQWSPDGQHIAFSASAKDGMPAQIFILDVADKELNMISYEMYDAISPHWLPAEVSPYNQISDY